MNQKSATNTIDYSAFTTRLSLYKNDIDTELDQIAKRLLADTKEQFGSMPEEVVQAYLNVLTRGGKRIRGALAIASYEMFGGSDSAMIRQAAAALEMLNTYILIADDIQDRSETRRGGITAHMYLHDYHKKHHLKGDALHFGESMAINSFLIAQHYASNIITALNVPADIKIKALDSVNKCFIITAHGQTMDLYVEASGSTAKEDIQNILIWKTAYYTFINPLQLGALLAGANTNDIDQLNAYGLQAGKVFQITDDIIGTFGDANKTGKSQLDDIKEGKRTLLVAEALSAANTADAYFLEACLGNQQLTQSEFEKCQRIITDSGALSSVRKEAQQSADLASMALQSLPESESKQFLIQLAQYLLVRES